MSKFAVASKVVRITLWVVLAVVLLVVGVVAMLYTPMVQTRLKDALVHKLNANPGIEVTLDTLSLKFPLDLTLSGVSFVVNGDTMVAARTLKADVALMPLLKGNVDVKSALLADAQYNMGNPDSLTQVQIHAKRVQINSAKVGLSPLDINIVDGKIAGGQVTLISKPDTVLKPPADTASDMKIRVGRVELDNFVYRMRLEYTIDSLGATIGHGMLSDGLIDLKAQTLNLKSVTGHGLKAAYVGADSAQIASAPPVPVDTVPTKPWTISIDSIGFSQAQGLYTTYGYTPLPGLDFGYIQADDMEISIKDFYNQQTTIRLPIHLTGTERCGVRLTADGTFAMDANAMHIDSMRVVTADTYLWADAMLGVGDMTADPSLPMSLQAVGVAGVSDLSLMFPDFAPYFKGFAKDAKINIDVEVNGTPSHLNVPEFKVGANGIFSLKAKGFLADLFSTKGIGGNLALSGNVYNVKNVVKAIMEPGSTITVPPMSLNGNVALNHGDIKAKLQAKTHDGTIALDGNLNSVKEIYNLDLTTHDFPVNAFMPELDLTKASIDVKAQGNGFDIFSPKTNLNASVIVNSLTYAGVNYHDISLNAAIVQGKAEAKLLSKSPALQCEFNARGNLDGETLAWTYDFDGQHINLQEMGFSPEKSVLTAQFNGDAQLSSDFRDINVNLHMPDLGYETENVDYAIRDIKAVFATADSLTSLSLLNRDLTAQVLAPCSLDTLLTRFSGVSAIIDSQIHHRQIKVDSLQKELPPFDITVNAGSNNLINDILSQSKMSIRHFSLSAANDSTIGLTSNILGLRTETMRIDTIGVFLRQDGDKMRLEGTVNNRPGTLDDFAHISLDCLLNTNKLSMRITQQNINDQTGFDIGAITAFEDSTVNARIFPLTPTIGYKKWSVNFDNYIIYNFPKRMLQANLKMRGDNSSVQLYTKNEPEMGADSTIVEATNLFLKISDVKLAEWLNFNPFAPPINGTLSADLNMKWNGKDDINGSGNVSIDELYYDRQRVGSFLADVDVNTTLSGMVKAKADLSIDGQRTMTIAGTLNDQEAGSPFNLDFSVIRFPLKVANPFLPRNIAQLTGWLNGEMDISGDAERPILNGQISFDQAAIKAPITNTTYAISDVKIPVVNNMVTFEQFNIKGANDNPLYVDGTVDVSSMINPKINLSLNAKNMMLVNTSRAARGAEIFGKAYIDLDTKVKGDLEFLNVDAKLKVLSGTNVTYVLTDAASTMVNQTTSDMVKFVNFNDSLEVMEADSVATSSMLLNIDASLQIQPGTTIVVDLPTASRDKVQVQPQGSVTYTQSPVSDGRVVGRIDIDGGFARYTLPVIGSEKNFTFDEGSYVAFNGDMMNPVLNLHATDEVKANVTQEGQNSRLVNFDILLGVTGTLANMDVQFNLATNDDITIANELQSMTPEQRANQAMNLLLYNMYTGPGTKATANLSANPLFSFLESQINNWAANNIKGVDLSFGIDQYNQTTDGNTSQTMSYSYRVSKSLFNDRFKIVIGGNYTTDANADENLSENLINDISFEYFLNRSHTMLLKVFRHTGYESILEGEITKTGVGFVYKRKMNNLIKMVPKFMRPRKKGL